MVKTYLIILTVYLIATFIIGIYAGKASTSMSAFYVGGRSLGPWVIATTWAATLISASTFIGVTGYGYRNGWAGVIWGGLCMSFGGILAWVLLGKRIRLISEKVNALTIPGLLFARYENKTINTIIAVMIFIFYIPMLMVQFVSSGILMESIFGIPYMWGIILFGIIVVFYTTAGGFLAVAYTDFIQAIVMVICFLFATPIILSKIGGIGNLQTALQSIDPGLLSPHGVNNAFPNILIVSWVVYYLFGSFGQPYMLIRFATAKNLKVMKLALPIAMVFITWMYFNVSVMGFGARILLPGLDAPDEALPQLIKTQLNAVLGGIMISAIFAAMMSTVDSTLHVVGTAVAKDLYSSIHPDVSEKKMLMISRLATGVVGAIGVIASMNPPDSVLELTTYGWTCLSAALFMPVVAGMFWKRFNAAGAMASMLGGGISGAIVIGLFGGISIGVHPMMIALPIAIVCGIAGSLLTPPPEKRIVDVFFDRELLNKKETPGS
ncbi:sodium/proline symporter [[Clostridium] symbiosum]|uniref:sodium/proline symporter n=1 Tax=Clostridium symbiosum TaxID=1512 RepID=UPI001D088C9F|nr:sodium/proline symporter [[Clostridium] symbiosum]MCB6608433.1 sodium/proline symporter [[Clostridium] symbiosum]MCB6930647.1 sodium/proline symporter [[Clostridium] symbiosum]